MPWGAASLNLSVYRVSHTPISYWLVLCPFQLHSLLIYFRSKPTHYSRLSTSVTCRSVEKYEPHLPLYLWGRMRFLLAVYNGCLIVLHFAALLWHKNGCTSMVLADNVARILILAPYPPNATNRLSRCCGIMVVLPSRSHRPSTPRSTTRPRPIIDAFSPSVEPLSLGASAYFQSRSHRNDSTT